MKFILPLLSTVLLISCAAQPKYKDVVLEGPAADLAFHEWSAALPHSFTYPVEYRFDMNFGLLGIPELEGEKAVFKVGSDVSLVSAWDYRMQSKLSLEVLGQEIYFNLGTESNSEELRISMDNTEFIAMQLGADLPSGVVLSTDRVRQVWDLILHLTQISVESVEGFEDFAAFSESLTGFGDFAHPMLNSRYLAMSPMLAAGRWQVEGDQVHVNFKLNKELFEEMMMSPSFAEAGMDMDMISEVADNMVTTGTFNVLDGSMSNMTVLASIPFADDFGDSQPVEMSMTFDCSPLVNPVAPVEFSDPSSAMDLNTYFDEFWPMVDAMMPMLESMMRQEMMNQSGESGEDFDF